MPGPEQPDKTTDKSSTQSGKLEKSTGEKLVQDAFPAPPKDGMSGSSSKGAPSDKLSQSSDKPADPVKTPTGQQDQPAPPAEKQSSKTPADFGSQPPPEKQPSKPPPSDFGGQPQSFDAGKKVPPADTQFDKPPPPSQPSDFKTPEKDPAESNKKVAGSDSFNPQQSTAPVEPRSTQSDGRPRTASSDTSSGGQPPADQRMSARNSNQDLPEKLPQKQQPQDSGHALDQKPTAQPREERAAPSGSETPRPQDAPRVAPHSAPEADRQSTQRAAEHPRAEAASPRDSEKRTEAPQARAADTVPRAEAQHGRSSDAAQAPAADRARSTRAAEEAGHLERSNLNPRDNPAASRSAPADVATSRRGEAALAESLPKPQGHDSAGRARESAEMSQDRSRHLQGTGRAGGDEARPDNTVRQQPARGSFEKAAGERDVAARASAAADTGRAGARDAHETSARGDGSLRSAPSGENITRHTAGEHGRSPEHAPSLRPEMKALADIVGRSRSDMQDAASARAARADLQASPLPQSMDGQAIKQILGTGERGHAERRPEDRGALSTAAAAEKTGPATPKPLETTIRTHDPAAGAKVDASGARPIDNSGARQPGRAPADGTAAQPGSRSPVDAAAGARQPDRGAGDGQGQIRQPVKGATDVSPVRPPGAQAGDGKATMMPPQKGSDAVTDSRTHVTSDNTGRLPTSRPDGSDRAPVKPGSMFEPLKPGEKRELTGAEIAIAAIVAAAGAARVRPEDVRIQRVPQAGDKDPTNAVQEALTVRNSVDIPAGFVPALHVEGDAIALKGPGSGESVEKSAIADVEQAQDQDAATAKPVYLRPTCLVSENDTLVSIAEELFHDPNLGWLIADLNRNRVQERWEDNKRIVEVASRQELFVPVWQDIVEFYERRPDSARPENLVTIVSQSQLDRELLNATLANVVGSGAPAGQFAAPIAAAAKTAPGDLSAVANLPADWKTRATGLQKATAAALLAFSNRWPKPPAAPASDDLV